MKAWFNCRRKQTKENPYFRCFFAMLASRCDFVEARGKKRIVASTRDFEDVLSKVWCDKIWWESVGQEVKRKYMEIQNDVSM